MAINLKEYFRESMQKYIIKFKNSFEPKNSNIQDHIASIDNPHQVDSTTVGLGNVDNTSDDDKPISDATQTALDTKVNAVVDMGLSSNDFTDQNSSDLQDLIDGSVNGNGYLIDASYYEDFVYDTILFDTTNDASIEFNIPSNSIIDISTLWDDSNPQWYIDNIGGRTYYEYKKNSEIGLNPNRYGEYSLIITVVYLGVVKQIMYPLGRVASAEYMLVRTSLTSLVWQDWKEFRTTRKVSTYTHTQYRNPSSLKNTNTMNQCDYEYDETHIWDDGSWWDDGIYDDGNKISLQDSNSLINYDDESKYISDYCMCYIFKTDRLAFDGDLSANGSGSMEIVNNITKDIYTGETYYCSGKFVHHAGSPTINHYVVSEYPVASHTYDSTNEDDLDVYTWDQLTEIAVIIAWGKNQSTYGEDVLTFQKICNKLKRV